MNNGEINSRNEKMNATVHNSIPYDMMECLIFNPIDFHYSFDDIALQSYQDHHDHSIPSSEEEGKILNKIFSESFFDQFAHHLYEQPVISLEAIERKYSFDDQHKVEDEETSPFNADNLSSIEDQSVCSEKDSFYELGGSFRKYNH